MLSNKQTQSLCSYDSFMKKRNKDKEFSSNKKKNLYILFEVIWEKGEQRPSCCDARGNAY